MMTKYTLFFSVLNWGCLMATLGAPLSTAKAQNQSLLLRDSLAPGDTLVGIDASMHRDSFVLLDTLDLDKSEQPIKKNIFDALYSEQIRSIRLVTDLQGILDNRKTDESVNGHFHYWDEKGNSIKKKVKIQVRGKTRRKICDFPPLRLKFKKKQLKKANLSKRNTLKLVTHCLDGKSGNQNILKEFLIYKMYNQICDISFRVQLLNIEYIDAKDTSQRFERLGFLIENDEALAKQKSCKVIENQFNSSLDSCDRIQFLNLALFQYMIGNTDWYVKMLHNIKLMRSLVTNKLIIVPYDFDYSGFVNTKYAKPNPNLGQTSVKERIYMGVAESEEDLNLALQAFRNNKDYFFNQIDQMLLLHEKEKKKCKKYLREFYKTIENPQKVRSAFLQN
ncbi:MAG: hypothetical protein AAF985_17365 [Bacteroidota bacterium]